MRFADTEQVLGVVALVGWALVAALSVCGRLPHGRRLSAATSIGTGVAAVVFALQATVVDAVADPDGISAADVPVLDWFVGHRSPGATALALTISAVGGTAAMAVLAAVATLVLWFRRRRWEAVVVVLASAGAGVLVETLKNVYDRPRPPEATRLAVETNYSLPSGHALGSTVVLGVLCAVAVVVLRGVAVRTAAVVLAVAAVAVIGLSRLYLGVHWLTDVLDGWLVGATWLALCVTLLLHRRPVPVPDPDPGPPADGSAADTAGPRPEDPRTVRFTLDPSAAPSGDDVGDQATTPIPRPRGRR
ncbi:phosphatase PAP2 family protein [Pseudonocardia kujensis]|uniref:phosphatase PAP2 family protein n=1 Tax=Pseudonocardia kujensis TaxID=1128675 RepID=UPI001E375C8E|nr:phosphatase PAP2 family protein [Pseudonocardia kujensis]MCE0763023.1 phosphatase PAP2 family protein [Pseudonocardia kujensis]